MEAIKALVSGNQWKFKRVGGIYQVELSTVDDLRALPTLDPKLWVALSCPVNDLEVDRATLELVDHDADGRVRIEEMLTAVEWTLARLRDPSSLFSGDDLPLQAINTKDDEGQALYESAKQILNNLGASESSTISVAQAGDTQKIYGQTRLNGDGVIGIDATDDPEVTTMIQAIIQCIGGEIDRSGAEGITAKSLSAFYSQLDTYESWWARGEIESAEGANVFPLGEKTPSAFSILANVEKKVDDFFARCQLAQFDPRAESPLNHDVRLYDRIAEEDFSTKREEIEKLPLSRIISCNELPLESGINPLWKNKIDQLEKKVLRPLKHSSSTLSIEEWEDIKKCFSDYRAWLSAKPKTGVEQLSITQVREFKVSPAKAQLEKLLAEDQVLAPKMRAVDSVEKLARYHRDLVQILKNFVNFSAFYDESQSAIFQAGTLFLDGRECRLCLRVADPSKHAALANLSRAFVAYCECRRKGSNQKFNIAAIFSDGDSSNLIVGRNGIFKDNQGLLWDSTIKRIIENPISVREAFWLPYIRVGRFIGTQIEKWAITRDKAIQSQLETGITDATVIENKSEASKSKTALHAGGVAGILAAGGIALGAVGAGLASLFNTLKALAWWEIPIVISGLIIMISFPSMLIAWLKIRKRTLAPLLDASGWAVNGRTLISPRLGRSLTLRAQLPLGSTCNFDERRGVRWWVWLALGIAIASSTAGWTLFFL